MEIEFLFEDGNEYTAMGIFVRGHVDPNVMAEAWNHDYDYAPGHRKHATPEKVMQLWARCLPSGVWQYLTSPGRGAFPVTIFEW